MVGLVQPDRRVAPGVVDDDVTVGTRLDDALLPVHPEHPRRGRRGHLDPALERDVAVHDPLVHEVHTVFDRTDPVGDLREIAEAEVFLALHTERAVVGRDHLDVVGAQRLPHVVLVALLLRPQRCRAHPLRPLEVAPLGTGCPELLLERQVEVLRTGLTEHVLATIASRGDLVDGLLGADVHHVQGCAGEVGNHDRAMGRLLLRLPRAGKSVEVGRGVSGVDGLLHQYIDDSAVLRVHHHERAV